MLTLNQVSKYYGSFCALEHINLEFSQGMYALLSPNGAGKTTLIKLITTLIFPSQGVILWRGENIHHLGSDYRDLIGFLPQEFGYYKNHTPTQFLDYIAALKQLDPKNTASRIDEVIELAGLTDVKNKKMKKLSGGMIQRVGIAQALLNDPKLLILDEPTAGLDPKERVRFRNLISSLAKDRIIILSTHIVSDIETIASQVILLKNQSVFLNDTPARLVQRLSGKVFQTSDLDTLSSQDFLLSEHFGEGQTLWRFLSDNPPKTAIPVNAQLEDVFLDIYRDEVT